MGTYYVDNVAGDDTNNGTAEGTPWQHCPGDASATDNAAITLTAGDTVYFKKGVTYTGTITVNASGTSGSRITLGTTTWGVGTYATIDANGGARGITCSRSYVTISGLEIINATGDGSPEAGIYGSGCVGTIITGCSIHANDNYNIYLTGVKSCTVSSNLLDDSAVGTYTGAGASLWLVSAATSAAERNLVYSNTVHDGEVDGITIHGKYVSVYLNTVYNFYSTTNHGDGIVINGQADPTEYIEVYRNTVYDAGQMIYLDPVTTGRTVQYVYIYDNVVYETTDGRTTHSYTPVGIHIAHGSGGHAHYIYIENNTVVGCTWALGLGGFTGDHIYCRNNICSQVAASTDRCVYWSKDGTKTDIYFDYNLYQHHASGADVNYKQDAGDDSLTFLEWQGAPYSQEANGVDGDPLFTNTATYDFTIAAAGAATDVGTLAVEKPSVDRIGAVRPQGDGIDIGAYEYAGAGAAAYYVDFTAGNDANNGTADSTPWKHCPGDANATGVAAAAVLYSGDTVYFKKGITYTGHIYTVAAGVTYTTTTWGTGVATIDGTGTAACIDVAHNNCIITGGTAETLKLTGADIKAAVHVYNAISGVNGLTVSYCTFEDIGTSGSQERIGLKVGGSEDEYQNIAISYCTFTNVVYYAIKVSGNPTHDVTIHHNTITNCGSGGGCQINCSQSGTTGAGIYDCSIYSNTIHTGAGTSGGINILNPGVNVYSNTIYGHSTHGVLFTFNSYAQEGVVDVYKNLIRDNAGVGIKINYTTAAKHCQIYNNLIARNGSDADLSINTYADSNEIYNNSIYADSGVTIAAIWCSVSSNSNIIKNNAVHSTNKPCLLEASGDTTEDYNVFYSPNSSTVSYGGTAYTVLATYRTAKSQGANSVWSDPIFPSPGGNNFAITDGSPCVDAGMDASAILTDDYAGTSRGATYDAGAYEYVPGVDPPGFYVYYLGNGSLSGSIPSDSTPYPENDPVTVIGNTGSLVKYSFYEFMGWNTAADGSGQRYGAGDTFTMPATDKVLYAEWRCKGIVFG